MTYLLNFDVILHVAFTGKEKGKRKKEKGKRKKEKGMHGLITPQK
jgi:hypothetical protein